MPAGEEADEAGEAGRLFCLFCPFCLLSRMFHHMPDVPKKLIVVGDRVLIAPEEGEERTTVGLYLPPTAIDHQAVQSGRILATGPGTPLSEPASLDDEPWRLTSPETRYVPMQPRIGDYALFFRKAAVEITFESKRYLVVPQAAILVLVRKGDTPLDDL